MQLPVYNLAGEVVRQIEVSDLVFGVPFNESVVHQVMVGLRANARQGTNSTKTRGTVHGSTRKLYRQKGTGNARAGSKKSPLRRGGGITFGPHPRDYRQDTPRKMRRLALRCVLSAKAGGGELKVLEAIDFPEPKTKKMAEALAALGVAASALIVTPEPQENVILSARNLPKIKTLPAHVLNVLDVLNYQTLLMTEAAVRLAEKLWGNGLKQGGDNASVRGAAPAADN
ncbi:MAG TPA: 50S ribosomal protein L4 [Dehalococcoidales bacterium]|nr:MAG: 50S ribosomal protein L4 [Chloroflexi bacterium RBG_16_60_22]HJX12318.1 50S ribosomal protein L4 [Dehalococcoidales bacterium]